MADLSGTIVLVTGAGGGIGGAVAELFGASGASLCLADIDVQAAERRARTISQAARAIAVPVDIRDGRSVDAMVEATIAEYGTVDVLVHCAGIDAPRGRAWELGEDRWNDIIDVDLNGAWRCARAVIPTMIAQGRGRIVFMGSVAGRRGSAASSVAYSAAKAGIHGLTMALSAQLEGAGVLVNAVAPGSTGTGEPMTDAEIAADRRSFPLPIAGPGPVAEACLYLASESGDWISGSILNVSGGRWRG